MKPAEACEIESPRKLHDPVWTTVFVPSEIRSTSKPYVSQTPGSTELIKHTRSHTNIQRSESCYLLLADAPCHMEQVSRMTHLDMVRFA